MKSSNEINAEYKNLTADELYKLLNKLVKENKEVENQYKILKRKKYEITKIIREKSDKIFNDKYCNSSLEELRLAYCSLDQESNILFEKCNECRINKDKYNKNFIKKLKLRYLQVNDEHSYLMLKLESKEFARLDIKYRNFNLKQLKDAHEEVNNRCTNEYIKLDEVAKRCGIESSDYLAQSIVTDELDWEEGYLADSISYGWYKNNFDKRD